MYGGSGIPAASSHTTWHRSADYCHFDTVSYKIAYGLTRPGTSDSLLHLPPERPTDLEREHVASFGVSDGFVT